jgi:hypothetical protein
MCYHHFYAFSQREGFAMRHALAVNKVREAGARVPSASLWLCSCTNIGRILGRFMKLNARTNRREPPERLSDNVRLEQYVVALPNAKTEVSLDVLLTSYPGIKVLQLLDQRTALVEMSEDANRILSRDHRDLLIERNIPYAMLGAH